MPLAPLEKSWTTASSLATSTWSTKTNRIPLSHPHHQFHSRICLLFSSYASCTISSRSLLILESRRTRRLSRAVHHQSAEGVHPEKGQIYGRCLGGLAPQTARWSYRKAWRKVGQVVSFIAVIMSCQTTDHDDPRDPRRAGKSFMRTNVLSPSIMRTRTTVSARKSCGPRSQFRPKTYTPSTHLC